MLYIHKFLINTLIAMLYGSKFLLQTSYILQFNNKFETTVLTTCDCTFPIGLCYVNQSEEWGCSLVFVWFSKIRESVSLRVAIGIYFGMNCVFCSASKWTVSGRWCFLFINNWYLEGSSENLSIIHVLSMHFEIKILPIFCHVLVKSFIKFWWLKITIFVFMLILSFFDWFTTKRNFVWCKINRRVMRYSRVISS